MRCGQLLQAPRRTMTPILFLDFDGVLNTPKSWGLWRNDDGSIGVPLEQDLVDRLAKFCAEHPVELVISSTWRRIHDRAQIIEKLGPWAEPLMPMDNWATDDLGERPEQIQRWLAEHAGAEDYPHIILEDDIWEWGDDQMVVQIDPDVGLQDADLYLASIAWRSAQPIPITEE